MQVLVINAGSSTLRVDVIDAATGRRTATAKAERVGTEAAVAQVGGAQIALPGADHRGAIEVIFGRMDLSAVELVGHRVVHGGERFVAPTLIDEEVEQAIEALCPIAPLHNPPNLYGIRAARAVLPHLQHVAVFDTAFHATLPNRARAYALPLDLSQKHGLRRYGFHGTNHAWVATRAAEYLNEDVRDLRIITLHLGNGASACAVEYGRSVETSMGMSPMEGLAMGTRSGDIDVGLVLSLMRSEGWGADEIDHLLNQESGLAGLSGRGSDLRDIEEGAAQGDEACRRAIQVYAHRVRKYIGAYAAVMGGVDVIAFTGGIGENSALMRHRILQRLEYLGARLDEDRNRMARPHSDEPVVNLDGGHGRVRLLTVHGDEGWAIARTAAQVVGADPTRDAQVIPIAVSARHVHLTQEAVEKLFGIGATLTPRNPLSQPGQFASEQVVDLVGPKRTIEGVRVLGPVRSKCQVEVSRTDEYALGIDAPMRGSGDVAQSAGITLRGPAGTLTLKEGVIVAWRHIHMTPEDAERFGVQDRDLVEVTVSTEQRNLTFGDVMIRVDPSYKLEMHLDTDEANAAQLGQGALGMLVATGAGAHLRRKRVQQLV